MALSALTKDIANNVERSGGVFVTDDGGTNYYDLGQVKNVEVTWEPVLSEADVAGRQKMLAADFEINIVMQQTSDTELAELDVLAGVLLDFKFTTVATDAAGADAAAGYVIENALPEVGGTLNFAGGESMMPVTLHGRVSVAELAELGNSQTLTFDA